VTVRRTTSRMGAWLAAVSLLAALLACAALARAGEPADFVGRPVAAVHVEGGDLPEAEALGYVDVHAGERLSLAAVRRSVKRLYLLGLFGQVRVTALPAPGGEGIELTFHLQLKTRVRKLEIVGAEAIPETDLLRLCRLQRGEEYDHWKLKSSAADMLTLAHRRGYRAARIISSAESDGGRDVRVSFFVQEGEPTRVARVELGGETGVPAARLREEVGLEAGDVLDLDVLEGAEKRLLAFLRAEGFLAAQVTVPRMDGDRPAAAEVVALDVRAGPRVTLAVEGAEAFREKRLLEEVDLKEGLGLATFQLRDQAEHIAEFYRRHGHARVRVVPRLARDDHRRELRVTFQVVEGPRVEVAQITFEGNRVFSDAELRAYVEDAMLEAIPQPAVAQFVDPGDLDNLGGAYPPGGRPRRPERPQAGVFDLRPETIFLEEPYETGLRAIADLYRSRGYLEAAVGPAVLSYDPVDGRMFVDVPVSEGPQTRVESVTFEGNLALASAALLAVTEAAPRPVRPGLPLDGLAIEELRRALQQHYTARGYTFCQVEPELVFSEDRSLAEVRYRFREGPQVRVGRVLVQGNLATDRVVFDRLLSVEAGKPFTPKRVVASREDLLDLNVFSSVEIKLLDPEEPAAVKDVAVEVRERLSNAMALSPGLSSGEGVRLAFEYTHRNVAGYAIESVNRAKVNYQVFYPLLTSALADRLRELSFFEGLEWSLLSGLHWPKMWWVGRNVTGRLDLLGLHEINPSYELTKVSFTPGLDFKLREDLSVNLSLELEYNSLVCPFGAGSPCGGATGEAWLRYDEGALLLLALRPEISWDRRDNPFNPREGTYLSLRTELAKSLVAAGEVFYLKLDGQVAGYIPLGRLVTLALMLRAGSVVHLLGDSRTPSHKLFFLGGRNTVRGFPEDQLIPADLGVPCIQGTAQHHGRRCVSPGGNTFMLLKAELRFPLWPGRLDGAVFVDAGNLWQELASFRPYLLRPTAGLGFRLVTPLGPVAFDVGVNLVPDEARAEAPWSFHFNVGVF
jgi:outer membrane protein insertion porin family